MLYVNRELDELEREDFTRLKKVQAKKIEKQKIEDALKVINDAEVAAAEKQSHQITATSSSNAPDMMAHFNANDEDVVFN